MLFISNDSQFLLIIILLLYSQKFGNKLNINFSKILNNYNLIVIKFKDIFAINYLQELKKRIIFLIYCVFFKMFMKKKKKVLNNYYLY
jgi:hypothetical protein